MKKIILLCLLTNVAFAQKENYNWTFSDSMLLRFDENGPTEINNANIVSENTFPAMGRLEANTTLSDKKGNLSFYFDPTGDCNDNGFVEESEYKKNCGKIFNRFNERIINGDSISISSTFTNGALFLPVPGNTEHFYLFTLGWGFEMGCNPNPQYAPEKIFYYTLIDTTEGYINAKVTQKNIPLTNCTTLSEKLTAVKHSNGQDWWLLLFNYNSLKFTTFLVDKIGIHGPFEQIIPNFFTLCPGCTNLNYGGQGEICASPSGEKIAAVGYYSYKNISGIYEDFKYIDLFDFNRCTGELNNHLIVQRVETNGSSNSTNYGCAFSPKEKYLYVTDLSYYISRILLSDISIKDTIYPINFDTTIVWYSPGQMELGPDNKIYVAHWLGDTGLSVINKPDDVDCQFTPYGLSLLGKKTSVGLPHFPNFGLGALVAPGVAEAGPDRVACIGAVGLGTPALPGMVYRWRPAAGLSDTTAATPLAAPGVSTTYTLTVWDSVGGTCGAVSDTVRVWVNELPVPVNFTYTIDGFNVFFTSMLADTVTYKSKWYFGDGDSSLLKNPAHTYADTGYYAVTLVVTDTSGCSVSLTQNIPLGVPNEILPLLSQKPFKIYPNPTDGHLTIQCSVKNATVELLDNNGRVLLSEKTRTLDLSRFAKGVYYVRLVKGLSDIVGVEKIVLE